MSNAWGKLTGHQNKGSLDPLFHDPKKIGTPNKNDEGQANKKMRQESTNQQFDIYSRLGPLDIMISSIQKQHQQKQSQQKAKLLTQMQLLGQYYQRTDEITLQNTLLNQQKQQLEEKINKLQKQQQKHDSTVKQLNQKIKKLTQSNQQSIKHKENYQKQTQQQRKQLIDKIKIYLGGKDEKLINGNFVPLIKHQTLLAQVQKLGQKLVDNKKLQKKQRQFLTQTFDLLVSKFEKVKTQNFVSSGYKQGLHSFFKETVQDLSKKIIDDTDMNVLSKGFYQKLIAFLSQVNTKVDEILSSWNGQLKIANSEIKDLLDEKDRLERQIAQKQARIQTLLSDNQSLNLDYETKVNKVNKLTIENQILTNQKVKFEKNIKELEFNLQKEVEELEQKNQQLIKIKQTHEAQSKKLNNQIKELKNKVNELEIMKNKLQIDFNKSKRDINDLKSQISKLSTKLREQQRKSINYSNDAQQLTKTIERLNQQLQKVKNIISQKNTIIDNQNKQISQLKQKYLTLNGQYGLIKQKNNQLKEIVNNQTKQIQKLDKIPKFVRCYAQYFNGNLLNYKTTADTQWFVNNIETYMNRKILSTKFLYRLDPENRNSFHNYIDCIPHLVVIVKHANGQIIGAYSQAPLEKGFKCDLKKGLMVGFKNRAVFHVKTQSVQRHNKTINPRPVTWDQNYIIFGNSDLRIIQATPKADNLQIYSNYATSGGSFEERNKKGSGISNLFTEDNRTGKYVDFEVFSIIFQQ